MQTCGHLCMELFKNLIKMQTEQDADSKLVTAYLVRDV